MKKNLLMIALLGSISFLGCKKDEGESPALPNEQTFKLIDASSGKEYALNDTVRNTLAFKLELPETNAVNKVEVHINGTLHSSDTESPFEFSWNTLPIEDGSHSIKIIALDKAGNKVEKTISLFVHNTLLKLKINKYHYSEEGKAFLIISNSDGQVLYSTSIENNTSKEIKIDKPYFKETINITEVNNNGYAVYSSSYIDIKRGGSWELGSTTTSSNPPLKSVNVHLKNATDFSYVFFNTDYAYMGKEVKNLQYDTTKGMTMDYFEGSKLYVEVGRGGNKYFGLVDVIGADVDVNVDNINQLLPTNKITMPLGASPFYNITAVKEEQHSSHYYALNRGSNHPEGSLDIINPGNVFSKYYCYWGLREVNNKSYSNWSVGSIPTDFKQLIGDANVLSRQVGNFKATLSGDFDFYLCSYSYRNTEGRNNPWYVYVPAGKESYKLPEIAEIIGMPEMVHYNFTLQFVELTDYNNYSNVSGYFKYYTNRPNSITNTHSSSVYISIPNDVFRHNNISSNLGETEKATMQKMILKK